jgi:hypothetical protein
MTTAAAIHTSGDVFCFADAVESLAWDWRVATIGRAVRARS